MSLRAVNLDGFPYRTSILRTTMHSDSLRYCSVSPYENDWMRERGLMDEPNLSTSEHSEMTACDCSELLVRVEIPWIINWKLKVWQTTRLMELYVAALSGIELAARRCVTVTNKYWKRHVWYGEVCPHLLCMNHFCNLWSQRQYQCRSSWTRSIFKLRGRHQFQHPHRCHIEDTSYMVERHHFPHGTH